MTKELKQRYNSALEHYRKAEAWFDDPKVPQAEKEKHLDRLIKIMHKCSDACTALQKSGIKMTSNRIQNGFPEIQP